MIWIYIPLKKLISSGAYLPYISCLPTWTPRSPMSSWKLHHNATPGAWVWVKIGYLLMYLDLLYFFGVKKNGSPKKGSDPFRVFWKSQVNARRKLKHLAEFGLKMLVTPRRFAVERHGCHGCHGALGVHDEMESPYRDGVFKHPTCHGKSSRMVG